MKLTALLLCSFFAACSPPALNMYHASVTTPEGAVYQVTNRDGSSLSFETSDGQKNVKIVSDDKGQPGIFKNLADLMLLKEANK